MCSWVGEFCRDGGMELGEKASISVELKTTTQQDKIIQDNFIMRK
jgi:hypothetical protein